jgi:transcriptional regulator with XRE-family HTH domain
LQRLQEQVAAELPEMASRDQLRREAREEATLSGELRRAIHASPLSLSSIAAQARIDPIHLDEFLSGERTLRSDVLDRLAGVLGYDLATANGARAAV